jgi:hypothetical protein
MLKVRMTEEEQSELSTKCVQLKLKAKDVYEKETKKCALSNKNALNYEYIDEKLLDEKKENESSEELI